MPTGTPFPQEPFASLKENTARLGKLSCLQLELVLHLALILLTVELLCLQSVCKQS